MKSKSHILMTLSVVAAGLAAVNVIFETVVLDLAATQWILIGIILGVWGNHIESCGCCVGKIGGEKQ